MRSGPTYVDSGGFGPSSTRASTRGIGGGLRLNTYAPAIQLVLDRDQFVACWTRNADKFVQFELDSDGIATLGVLDQEDHKEGHDGGPSVDDQLPRFGPPEEGTADRPYCDSGPRD